MHSLKHISTSFSQLMQFPHNLQFLDWFCFTACVHGNILSPDLWVSSKAMNTSTSLPAGRTGFPLNGLILL